MQKKIIALAVAAAFSAPAFADTTVYGVVDAAIANISTTGYKGQLTVLSGGLSTSRLGVKSVQDLDNGMKVVGVLEYKLDVANSQGSTTAASCTTTAVDALGNPATCTNGTASNGSGILAARQQMIALAGDFGTVAAGYLQTTGYDFATKFNPTAGSAVDSYASANLSGLINTGARAPHAAAYISPNMGGVTVAFNHAFDVANTGAVLSTNNAVATNRTTANLLSVNYDGGPLSVGGVYAATANDGTGYTKETDLALGASYDLGAAKLFATYQTTKVDAATSPANNANKEFSFAAVAPMGPGALVATVAKNTKDSTTGADNTTAFTVAYLDNLSKTTTGYVAAQNIKTDATPSSITTTILAIGVREKF